MKILKTRTKDGLVENLEKDSMQDIYYVAYKDGKIWSKFNLTEWTLDFLSFDEIREFLNQLGHKPEEA